MSKASAAGNVSLTTPIRLLRATGVDRAGSSLTEQSDRVDFSFRFEDRNFTHLSCDGSYHEAQRRLAVGLSFCTELKMRRPDGEISTEWFRVEAHFEAQKMGHTWSNQSMLKEDVYQLALKITKDIAKLHAEGKGNRRIEAH